jgi:hypothetical protein
LNIYELIVWCLLGLTLVIFGPTISEMQVRIHEKQTGKKVSKLANTVITIAIGIIIIVFNILIYFNVLVYR